MELMETLEYILSFQRTTITQLSYLDLNHKKQ